jgi:hypothetical protein
MKSGGNKTDTRICERKILNMWSWVKIESKNVKVG